MANKLMRIYNTQTEYDADKNNLHVDTVSAIIENDKVFYGVVKPLYTIATYNVLTTTSKTLLFGGTGRGNSSLVFDITQIDNMYIDDIEVPIISAYTFSTLGEHTVKCTFNRDSLTDMSGMFQNCTSLTSLDVSNFDTSNVTDMSYMFHSCNGLTSLIVSSFDTSNVTTMSDMFRSCSGLTSLDVSNFDTSNVTDMDGMFQTCTSLTSLDLSSFDTSNVTNMRSMFYLCTSLTSLDLSSFKTSNVTNMSQMFYNCEKLELIDFRSKTANTEVGDIGKLTNYNNIFSGVNANVKFKFMCENDWETILVTQQSVSKFPTTGTYECISHSGGEYN